MAQGYGHPRSGGRPGWDCSPLARRHRWYSAGVQHEVWARLTSSFPSEALAWIVAEVEPGGGRVRLEPAWRPELVRRRLDEVLTPAGWSFSLSGAGGAGIVCALGIGNTTRSAVAGSGDGLVLEQLADLAFTRCARQFGLAPGVAPQHESYWVDYDADARQPLHEPYPVAFGGATVAEPPEPATTMMEREASGEALAMIERLVDRLKAEGLGKEAARLVAAHHGGSAEQARELYGRLRALLKQEARV